MNPFDCEDTLCNQCEKSLYRIQFSTVAVIENVPTQILSSSTQKIAEAFCIFDAALDLQKFFKGSLPYPTP